MAQPTARQDDHDPEFDGSMLELVADALGFIVGIYELDEDLVYLSGQWNRLTADRPGPSYLPIQVFRAHIHPDDVTRMSLALSECMRGDTPFWEVDLRLRTADGGWHAMLMQARVTARDCFGQAMRIMAVMFDLQRALPTQADQVQVQYLRASFEHNLMGLLVGTPEGKVLAANAAACRITGYAPEELQARGRDGLFDQSDPRLAVFLRRRRLLGQNSGQVRLLRKDGQGVDVEMSSVLYVDPQGLRRNVVCLRPLHEAGAGRELERALKWLQVRKQCTRAIIRSRSGEALLNEVCKVLCEVLDLPLVWAGQLDPANLAVTPRLSHGVERAFLDVAWFSADARIEEGGGPVGRALRCGRSQVQNDLLQDAEASPWQALAARHRMPAMLALPLAGVDEAMLLVLHARCGTLFSESLVDDLDELAREIAFALENLARDAALKESEERFRTLWESALDAIVILDRRGTIHYANPTLFRLFGHRIEEVLGRGFGMLLNADDKLAGELALMRWLARPQSADHGVPRIALARRRDGSPFPLELTATQALIDGEPRNIVQLRDVSLRQRAEQLSQKQNAVLRGIASGEALTSTLQALARLVDEEGEGWRCAFLLPADEDGPARTVAPGLSPAWQARACSQVAVAVAVDAGALSKASLLWPLLVQLGEGEPPPLRLWIEAPRAELETPAPPLLQAVLDLAALALQAHQARRRIRRLLLCDELTGLANRAAAMRALEAALARASRDSSRVGVMLIDLDGFKQINELHGQQAGDAALRQAAQALQASVRRGDVLARWNGDTFLVVMERLKGTSALSRVAAKLQKTLAAALADATGLRLAASMGSAAWPEDGGGSEDGQSCDRLLRRAELALRAARRHGGARHVRASRSLDAAPIGDGTLT